MEWQGGMQSHHASSRRHRRNHPPITSVSSVLGMNVIGNDHTKRVQLIILLSIMLAISLTRLRWARKQGWR